MTSAAQTTIALFPLTAHILPGGRLPLPIFEQRYIRMVKEALATQNGFGICMLDPDGDEQNNSHILPIGTLVRIINFDTLQGNMLGLTIEGEQLFTIQQIHTDADGLRTGEVQLRESWPVSPLQPQDSLLQQRLQEVFDTYPELAEMYPDKHLDNEAWICQRWLEILPLEPQQKQDLLASYQLPVTRNFIYQLLK